MGSWRFGGCDHEHTSRLCVCNHLDIGAGSQVLQIQAGSWSQPVNHCLVGQPVKHLRQVLLDSSSRSSSSNSAKKLIPIMKADGLPVHGSCSDKAREREREIVHCFQLWTATNNSTGACSGGVPAGLLLHAKVCHCYHPPAAPCKPTEASITCHIICTPRTCGHTATSSSQGDLAVSSGWHSCL